jgi:putative ABC transport system substrate-binding protein
MASGHPLDEAMLFVLGANLSTVGEQAAHLAEQIHRGIKPSDLPVGTAEFFIAVNLQTAQAIGIEIPEELLRQADTIIR